MALYDGFFDAVLDEDSEEYDRAYGSDDFVRYFEQIIGSGVCIHNTPDSFKVRWKDGAAVLSPGYLFIQGYWLKNDGDFTVQINGSGPTAIVAHLNKGLKMIEVEARSVSISYPDALVLALVDPDAGTVADTRYDIDICGVIDSAGGLSTKVEYAVNYIDNDIAEKMRQIEADILDQERALDSKITEVGEVVEQIAPPPIGSIKFSAAQSIGENWLKCDGRFVSGEEYPELVAALGKLPVGTFERTKVCRFVMGNALHSLCLLDNHLLVYAYNESPLKLYTIGLETGDVSEISVTLDGIYGYDPSTYRNLSAVKKGSGYDLYLTHFTGYSPYAANTDGTAANTSVQYYCCKNFDVPASTVTFTAKYQGPIPVSVPAEDVSNFPFFLGSDVYPSKVMEFDSVPYISLGYVYFTDYTRNSGGSYPPIGKATAKKYLAVCTLGQDVPSVSLHSVCTGKSKIAGTANISKNDFDFSALYGTIPDFSKGNGGCLYMTSGTYALELKRLSGEAEETLWRSGTSGDSIAPVNALPVLGTDSVFLGSSVSYPYTNTAVGLIELDESGLQRATGPVAVSNQYKEAAFLHSFGLFVFPNDGDLIFCSGLSDENQYVSAPSQSDKSDLYPGTRRSTLVDETRSRIYTFCVDTLFTAHLHAITLPDVFDPINGTNLPTLSLSGVPAYIKAKEDAPS